MDKVYFYCMSIGVLVLVLTLVFDFFDNLIPDIDFFDLDLGEFDIVFLPISMRSICLALTVFGALGLMTEGILGFTVSLVLSIAVGYICAVIYSSLIKYLKKHQSMSDDLETLLLFECKVSKTILKDGLGEIKIARPNQSIITLMAKSSNNEKIDIHTVCKIVELDKDIAIVEPF